MLSCLSPRLLSLSSLAGLGKNRAESAQSRRLEAWTTASVFPCTLCPAKRLNVRCTLLRVSGSPKPPWALAQAVPALSNPTAWHSLGSVLTFGEVTFCMQLCVCLFPFLQPRQKLICTLLTCSLRSFINSSRDGLFFSSIFASQRRLPTPALVPEYHPTTPPNAPRANIARHIRDSIQDPDRIEYVRC